MKPYAINVFHAEHDNVTFKMLSIDRVCFNFGRKLVIENNPH